MKSNIRNCDKKNETLIFVSVYITREIVPIVIGKGLFSMVSGTI